MPRWLERAGFVLGWLAATLFAATLVIDTILALRAPTAPDLRHAVAVVMFHRTHYLTAGEVALVANLQWAAIVLFVWPVYVSVRTGRFPSWDRNWARRRPL